MPAESPVAAWRTARAGAPPGLIHLVLADVDGVVTEGEGHAADLDVLARLAAFNLAALNDPTVPAVTLCTGRPAPYVEVMAQMIAAFLPCVFEHGGGLFDPCGYRFTLHPSLGPDHAAGLAALRAELDGPLLRAGRAFVQPGKETMITLHPLDGASLGVIEDTARERVASAGLAFTVERNVLCVDIRPCGIDKGEGGRWLASELDVDLKAMAGVGDSDPDLAFLGLVGLAAAPANATASVRARMDYVAAASSGPGLLEIVEHVIGMNRRAVSSH